LSVDQILLLLTQSLAEVVPGDSQIPLHVQI
jgi:hypothetical protein